MVPVRYLFMAFPNLNLADIRSLNAPYYLILLTTFAYLHRIVLYRLCKPNFFIANVTLRNVFQRKRILSFY